MPSENQAELAGGTSFHRQHGHKLFAAGLLRLAGLLVLLLGLALLAAALTTLWLH